jgi:hypothetical protein
MTALGRNGARVRMSQWSEADPALRRSQHAIPAARNYEGRESFTAAFATLSAAGGSFSRHLSGLPGTSEFGAVFLAVRIKVLLTAGRFIVFTELPILKAAPLAAAAARTIASSPAGAVALIESKMVPMRAQHPGQYFEAIFLRVSEALIKRRTRIGHPLKRGTRFGHPIGALRKPLERRRRRGGRTSILIRVFAGQRSLDSQLRQIAQCLLEPRPVLGLIGRKLEAGFERRNPRIRERGHVFGAQMMMPLLEPRAEIAVAFWSGKALLRKND